MLRREFLSATLVWPITSTLLVRDVMVANHPTDGVRESVFVADQRFRLAMDHVSVARSRGVQVHEFNGDLTSLWLDVLKPMWTVGRVAVDGMTSANALFCLEQLVREYRLRTTERESIGDELVRWRIAMRHKA